ncbi:capsular polysaccharide biosynthesis protein [Anaerobutyricum hallii]|jgi:capsular polysaccharide biosynthesis protein|uniref:Capsular polysaccharide biosynthesis protein n=1 Tax=Anaerobutyricum hallii TaxID=39488 RepID=A0A414B8R2_9FIRM|nr:Wzz/FepE/Etk N-terminal domain-containing protein [Anaerobutyricum hallii]RHC67470.1 capsular polysaccharide biosynthesis protein [Anaerobutyricum hallii]RHK40022.1 capsular polysaccharide biosynthesis protein [Anaerobutyricum hallii]
MSLINNRNEESTPEFEVISGGKEDVRSSFADRAEEETEIDLIDLAWALLDKIHYIVLCFLIGAVIMNAYSYFLVRPTYKSTAKMYVVSASKNSVVDLDALNIGTSLTADYEQLMLSYPVLEQVINKLNLDMDSDTLAKMITLENPTDTRILNINVVSTDPKNARDIANTLMDVSVDYLPKTMSTNAPNVAQKAKLADHKDGPSYTKYTIIGALAGAFLYCMYLVVKYLMDDTIHTADDMEKYFDIVPLAVIPDVEELASEKQQKKGKLEKGFSK